MHLHDVYYLLKPAIPRRIRAAGRRVVSRRRRRRFDHCWPIDEAAGRPPDSWPGWPDGKKFAFVLTHDVEGRRGLDRCRQLAQMEMNLGFRSSFNFVPEGEYTTPPSLRTFLNEAGFEVGVHDLHHDGKLYRSRKAFERHAERINHYLNDVGRCRLSLGLHAPQSRLAGAPPRAVRRVDVRHRSVRAAARRHADNLSVLGSERSGHRTTSSCPTRCRRTRRCFSFWANPTIDLWKKKLDWISSRGGMALVNVHPDYLSFDRPAATSEYRAGLYEQFLTHVMGRYGREAWFALPHEVATYVHDCHQ